MCSYSTAFSKIWSMKHQFHEMLTGIKYGEIFLWSSNLGNSELIKSLPTSGFLKAFNILIHYKPSI